MIAIAKHYEPINQIPAHSRIELPEGQRLHFRGYDYVICTVKADNIAEIKILMRNNWRCLDYFFNKETKQFVYIYGRRLDPNQG